MVQSGPTMIEVEIDSIRVSLMSQQRLILLKELHAERYLPIFIGPFEAEAISLELQEVPSQRPMTHDLLKSTIGELGGEVAHILVSDLRDDIFYARLVINIGGKQVDVDSRPSDAIALAVRVNAPIFIAESVMERAGVQPEDDVEKENILAMQKAEDQDEEEEIEPTQVDESKLSAFADFVNSLDLDDLEDSED